MAENDAALLYKIIYEEPADATSLNPYVPPGLSVVIAGAMAKNRDERYSSASEFVEDIRSFQTLQSTMQSRPTASSSAVKRLSAESPEAMKKAEKRVRTKLRFYKHVAFFVVINLILLLVNLLTTPRYLWFIWPFMVFSVFLGLHALKLFLFHESSQLRERMLEDEIRKGSSGKSRF